MRKSEREIKDFGEILQVLDRCATIRLGLTDGGYPYVVPLSFGWEVTEGRLNVYFHCAKEGKKIELIDKNGKVCVEADIFNGYAKTERGITADYESVIGFGAAERVYGEQAVHGIELLLEHCGVQGYSARDCVLLQMAAVYKISVERITGKRRFPRKA